MTEEKKISYEFDVSVETMEQKILKVQTLLYGILGIMRHMGLPDEINDAIMRVQRLIAVLNMLKAAYATLTAARMAAGDPFAWATAIIAVGGTAVTLVDEAMYSQATY